MMTVEELSNRILDGDLLGNSRDDRYICERSGYDLAHSDDLTTEFAHYGVKGMRWGVRKDKDRVKKAKKPSQKSADKTKQKMTKIYRESKERQAEEERKAKERQQKREIKARAAEQKRELRSKERQQKRVLKSQQELQLKQDKAKAAADLKKAKAQYKIQTEADVTKAKAQLKAQEKQRHELQRINEKQEAKKAKEQKRQDSKKSKKREVSIDSSKTMSDQELRDAINRIRMEQDYKKLTKKPDSFGKKVAKAAFVSVLIPVGTTIAKNQLTKRGNEYIDTKINKAKGKKILDAAISANKSASDNDAVLIEALKQFEKDLYK